jgi:hypothetical protein
MIYEDSSELTNAQRDTVISNFNLKLNSQN